MSEEQEFIDVVEPEKESEEPTITLLDLLHMELQDHMKTALSLKQQIEEAKTDTKKKYYKKKLKKNNIEALKVLTAIERIRKKNADKPTKMEAEVLNIEYPSDENKTDNED